MDKKIIETERLIIRKFNIEDAEALFQILSDLEVNKFLPMFPMKEISEAEEYIKNKDGEWYYAICLKRDNIPIGYIKISQNDSYDFGYGLKKEFWHQGIMTEAAFKFIEVATEMKIPYITATHDVNNPKSGEVMKRIGMTYCYSYREQWQPKNISVVFRMYQLNLVEKNSEIYKKYWDMYPHFIEKLD